MNYFDFFTFEYFRLQSVLADFYFSVFWLIFLGEMIDWFNLFCFFAHSGLPKMLEIIQYIAKGTENI